MRLVTRGDLDGLTSALLLQEVENLESVELVHPKDVQDGKVDVTPEDVLANVPFVPGCGLWFDHHSSEQVRTRHPQIVRCYLMAHPPVSADCKHSKNGCSLLPDELPEGVVNIREKRVCIGNGLDVSSEQQVTEGYSKARPSICLVHKLPHHTSWPRNAGGFQNLHDFVTGQQVKLDSANFSQSPSLPALGSCTWHQRSISCSSSSRLNW